MSNHTLKEQQTRLGERAKTLLEVHKHIVEKVGSFPDGASMSYTRGMKDALRELDKMIMFRLADSERLLANVNEKLINEKE